MKAEPCARAGLYMLAALALALALGSSTVHAQDPAAGARKAAVCATCHGPKGVSENREWPNLAGQKVDYLVKQMRKFRDGIREDRLMSPVAATLSDRDIDDLAAHYAGLRP